MEMNFWHRKWEANDIGFHESEANPHLVNYLDALALPAGARLFLPLCGKTRDIAWLLGQGYRVAGAELSKLAVDQLFADLAIAPEVSGIGNMLHYRATGIDVFVGDIFDLSPQLLGPVDGVYDRAALVALPQEVRMRYALHLAQLGNMAPQLLICYEYDQGAIAGPPFSIGSEEVAWMYADGAAYAATLLGGADVAGGLKGKVAARETVWLLRKTSA